MNDKIKGILFGFAISLICFFIIYLSGTGKAELQIEGMENIELEKCVCGEPYRLPEFLHNDNPMKYAIRQCRCGAIECVLYADDGISCVK